jgi:hypothetical protein
MIMPSTTSRIEIDKGAVTGGLSLAALAMRGGTLPLPGLATFVVLWRLADLSSASGERWSRRGGH